MLNEIWKWIKGLEYTYEISNFGGVRRYYKNGKIKMLKPWTIRGYPAVELSGKIYYVHRLVYETFIGPIPPGYEVNHMDENPLNSLADNLNLLTHKENVNWGTRNGRAAQNLTNNPNLSKQVKQLTKDGELVKIWPSVNEVERELGYFQSNISRCCLGIRPTMYGYKWEYL